jgi:hypothetical protein
MRRTGRVVVVFLVVLLAVLLSSLFTARNAGGGVRCEEKVLTDWSDNGRIDGLYPLHCYQLALERMPTDIRDYTNASDAIHRALTQAASASGQKGTAQLAAGTTAAVGANDPSSLPLPLVALIGVSLAVLAAGGIGYLARRRRAPDG